MKRVAIVSTGGGMLCSFGAGCFAALAKEHKYLNPEFIIAGSGSAGGALYYLAGQSERLSAIWTKHLASTKFISWSRFRKIMDIDYLIDVVLTELEPFDYQAFAKTHTEVQVPLILHPSKKTVFVNNKSGLPPLEILRAAKAVPFLYGHYVTLNDQPYSDGATRVPLSSMIYKAKAQGATHILVFDNQIENKFYKLLKTVFIKNDSLITSIDTEHVLTIKHTGSLYEAWTNNHLSLERQFQAGYEAVKNNPALRAWLE